MRTALIVASALLVPIAFAGCSREAASPVPAQSAAITSQEAIARVGDTTIRASALQTSTLASAVATEYGINRDDKTVLLLVALRKGAEGQEIAAPARSVVATVTDLRGQRNAIKMRELRTGDLLDYAGTVEITLPDTLRFEVVVVREDGAASTLQFNREFYPR